MEEKIVGVIYILTNPSFPAYVKIGYTDDIEERLKALNKSECVPYAFRLYAYYEVPTRLTDKKVHELIDKLNPDLRCVDNINGKDRKKEFYQMTPEEAYQILNAIATIDNLNHRLHKNRLSKDAINDDIEATKDRLEMFRFSMCNIEIGAELEFIDDATKKCYVVSDKKVEYDGNEYSLSSLAVNYPLAGTHYFKYNGQILNDLRTQVANSKGGITNE